MSAQIHGLGDQGPRQCSWGPKRVFVNCGRSLSPPVVGGNPGELPDPSWSPTFPPTDGWVSNRWLYICVSTGSSGGMGWGKAGRTQAWVLPLVPFCSEHADSGGAGNQGERDEWEAYHRPWEFLVDCPGGAEVRSRLPVQELQDSGSTPGQEFPLEKPLQCSCLENPMDRGASWAAAHGITARHDWAPEHKINQSKFSYSEDKCFSIIYKAKLKDSLKKPKVDMSPPF